MSETRLVPGSCWERGRLARPFIADLELLVDDWRLRAEREIWQSLNRKSAIENPQFQYASHSAAHRT